MRWVLLCVLSAALQQVPTAVAADLEGLLEEVRRERVALEREQQAREERFLAERDQRRKLLAEAREARERESERGASLRAARIDGDAALRAARERLDAELGELRELGVVFHQIASEALSALETSLISAEHPLRLDQARRLAGGDELPAAADLEALWTLLLDEIARTGTVTRFNATVVAPDGIARAASVTRAGPFMAVAGGRFLRYDGENGRLIEPPRQPAARFRALAAGLEQAREGMVETAIDPTRGDLLALLSRTPDRLSRIQQGGPVGYVIMGLGAIGLLIALERFIVLAWVGRRVQRQRRSGRAGHDSPVGRLLSVYEENPTLDIEALGLRLDEAILRELPRIKRGLGALAILAAVAPLLGLLGTVAGIIETFQAITLFGTGNPQLMSGGISVALVTTVMGLVVAIPLLLVHALLSAQSNRLVQALDETGAALLARAAQARAHAADAA